MEIESLYLQFLSSDGVSTDTRSIAPNQIYFALKGDNFDGNKYAEQALGKGARLAVVDNSDYEGENTLLVKDVLSTLQKLALHHRRQLSIPVIGLTGSNGKTTSKELIAAVLQQKYQTAFTQGNLNNHIGVPLTLLSITPEHEMAVVEMGANHQGEIATLCAIAEPNFGYITNFGKAHLEGFGGIEGVIKGKSELYDFLRQSNGRAFINGDDSIQTEQSYDLETISFGTTENCSFRVARPAQLTPGSVGLQWQGHTIGSQLSGSYNFYNLAAAACIGHYFKVELADVKKALEGYQPQNQRSQFNDTGRNQLIVDTYNANPSSMEAALDNLGVYPHSSRWAILGDMFEMGEHAAAEHQHIVDTAENHHFEKVILVGSEFEKTKTSKAATLKLDSTDTLLNFLKEQEPRDKLILIKGSRGMKLERCLDFL